MAGVGKILICPRVTENSYGSVGSSVANPVTSPIAASTSPV